jgi:flagellar hook-length control protein FliK
MDNHLLVSASNGKKAVDKSRTSEPGTVVDGDAFASLLEKELDGKSGKSEAKELVAGKDTNRSNSSKEARDKDEQQHLQRLGLKMDKMVGSKNFIYNLALKDPASLSISERQSLHLGEFSRTHLEVKDFQNALAQRGMHLKDLSFSQISNLTRSRSKEELSTRLDQLDTTHAASEHPVPGLVAPKSSAHAPFFDPKAGLLQGAASVSGVDRARQADQVDARRLQREDVIRQIMTHIDVQRVANQTEVALRLNPEFLGDMKIKLNFEGRNHVSADFETTSKETKALLDEGLDSLKDSFERAGMTLTRGNTHLVEHVS